MARIRKDRAGSDSFGHVWKKDGAVVDIDDADQIAALMAIPDGGFSEVTSGSAAPDEDDKPTGDDETKTDAEDEPDNGEVSEIDPDAPDAEPDDKPVPRKPAAKRPGRKPTSAADVQE